LYTAQVSPREVIYIDTVVITYDNAVKLHKSGNLGFMYLSKQICVDK